MTQYLTQGILHGLKGGYASTAINALLQIAFTPGMARLLKPAAFGLIAMANVVLRFGSFFSPIGVGVVLILMEPLSDEDHLSAFSPALLLGAGYIVILLFAASLATVFSKAIESLRSFVQRVSHSSPTSLRLQPTSYRGENSDQFGIIHVHDSVFKLSAIPAVGRKAARGMRSP